MTLASNQSRITSLLAGLQTTNPRLYEALKLMSNDLGIAFSTLYPIEAAVSAATTAANTPPQSPSIFTYTTTQLSVLFSWYSNDTAVALYELRKGTDWNTAEFITRTPSLGAAVDPQPVGTTRFLLKTLNAANLYSTSAVELDVIISALGSVTVTGQTIDNNVLLYWTVPTSTFLIDHYNIYRNGVKMGETSSTFFAIFETIAGSYTYEIEAVDTIGNLSSKYSIVLQVSQPPDFQLLTSVTVDLSTASLTNVLLLDGKGVLPVDLADTWETHFTEMSWSTPQDQINAGFALYLQENPTSAQIISAEIDFGVELTNVIINLTWSNEPFAGTDPVTISPSMKGAPASHVYGSYQSGLSVYFAAIRYLTIKIDFSSTTDAMTLFYNLKANADVKREVDSNNISCSASDTNGTIVYIDGAHDPAVGHGRKVFKDVDSVTVSAVDANNMPITAMYNFTDTPNPTQFAILCFDSSGRRVDAVASWKLRGIV